MSVSGLPFEDFRNLARTLPGGDSRALAATQSRNGALYGARDLGQIGSICEWLANWSGKSPSVVRPLVALFAGTHGAQDAQTREAVALRAGAIAAGQTAHGRVCSLHGLGLKILDLALDHPVGDIRCEPALSERDAAATMAFGMESVAGGVDLLAVADCANLSEFSSVAIFMALHGGKASDWSQDAQVCAIADEAAVLSAGKLKDPLEVLRHFGGREICAIAGAILAARVQHVPVLIDGPGAYAAAGVLSALDRNAIAHCRIAQSPPGGGASRMAASLGIESILELGMEPGEGEAAAIASGMVRSAVAMHG
ncbi:MAG: nicotinate-nucleotide--dimethylbenzimidazole phosphoribosyltransferase [Rhizobiaceae bacterium]